MYFQARGMEEDSGGKEVKEKESQEDDPKYRYEHPDWPLKKKNYTVWMYTKNSVWDILAVK